MLALRELLTCQSCFQEQAEEFHLMKVYLRAHVVHFEILEHLYQLRQLHICPLDKMKSYLIKPSKMKIRPAGITKPSVTYYHL